MLQAKRQSAYGLKEEIVKEQEEKERERGGEDYTGKSRKGDTEEE